MRITKLHLILFSLVITLACFFAYQYQQERKREIAAIEEQRQEQIKKEEEIARLKAEREQKKASAVKTIAVAGAFWTKGSQEGKDVSVGQATLHKAKELMLLEKYGEAEALASQSIEELKTAKLVTLKYTVKRRDTLWKIAKMKKHYGRGSMWPIIWRANEKKIPDFDVLRTRLVLIIPKSESEIKKFRRYRKI